MWIETSKTKLNIDSIRTFLYKYSQPHWPLFIFMMLNIICAVVP